MRLALILPVLSLGCADETISGYADPETIYQLVEIDSAVFDASATITFTKEGAATGAAPCNQWSATQSAPYPWFDLGPISATKRACPDLDAESQFFTALAGMTLAEVQGPTLILTNDEGREMVFRSQ